MVPKGWSLGDFHSFKVSTIDGDRGKNYPKKEDYLASGYALFLGADNIADGSLNSGKSIYISKEKHDAMRKGIVRDNDILLVMRGNGTGRSCIYTNKIKSSAARINSGLVIIRHDAEFTNVEYLHQLLQSPVIQKQFESFMFGSAQPQLTIQLLKKLKFLAAPLPEQRKIAQILSTWDKAITTTERLLSNRQQQKNALMQRLLTGKQRFAGFEGEWSQIFLGQVTDSFSGGTPSRSKSEYYGGNIPWIKSGEVNDRFISNVEESITQLGLDNSSAKIVPSNSILVAMYGATAGKVAINLINAAVNQAVLAIVPKENICLYFLFYFLEYQMDKTLRLVQGGQPNLNAGIIKDILINLPCLAEQQKIASVLSAADAEIATIQNQLDNLKLQKKALMQQLLTGKRRVKVDEAAA